MTLFTRTSAAVAELEAAFASASADPAPPSKTVADGWASSLAALAPSVAKMRATALESDPEKQLYAPAMRDKVLDLVARLEAAQAAFAPLQARPFRGRRRGAEGTTLLSSGHLGLRADAEGTDPARRRERSRRRLPLRRRRRRRRALRRRLPNASGAFIRR